MHFRTTVSSSLALLALGGVALADVRTGTAEPATGLPGVFENRQPAAVLMAQASDPSVMNLEEQMRALNGRVEELNFQILQMQEQLRKMQEDNEFRFQELEGGKKSDAGSDAGDTKLTERPAPGPDTNNQTAGVSPAQESLPPAEAAPGSADSTAQDSVNTFGTITFDENGNVVGGGVGDQATIPSDPNGAEQLPGADNTVVAALPQTEDPEELYRSAYDYILSGQYATAEAGFADHAKRFPEDVKAADARFWLGEAQLGQQKYRDAAEVFLAANKDYPDSKKAPDMLLKLGVSLAGLNQKDVACATFAEVDKRYPDISGALKSRVKQEQALAAC